MHGIECLWQLDAAAHGLVVSDARDSLFCRVVSLKDVGSWPYGASRRRYAAVVNTIVPTHTCSFPPFCKATMASQNVFFQGESGRSTRMMLRVIILLTIAAAAVSSRLFSVIRFESIIHECMCSTPQATCLGALYLLSNANWSCSRSVVQLSSNEILSSEWLLQLLGLV
jgi:hypothetical protein